MMPVMLVPAVRVLRWIVDPRVCLPSRRRRFIVRAHHCGPPGSGFARPAALQETACFPTASTAFVHG
jgi:hypothetical protein